MEKKCNSLVKKIIFRSYNEWGSSIMRGKHVCDQLKILGYDSHSIIGESKDISIQHKLKNIHDSVIVFIKIYDKNELLKLKRNNNILILDIIDCISYGLFSLDNICESPWDGIITPTIELISSINNINKNINTVSIPHHWDKRHLININKYDRRFFSLAYIGETKDETSGFIFKNKIPELATINKKNGMMAVSSKYTCHYSVRPRGSYYSLYKPNTKISTAAAVGSNIICSYDNSSLDLISVDYPYYTKSDIKSVLNMVKYAKETFGGTVWKQGLDMMAKLKQRTSLETIVGVDYVNYLKTFNCHPII